MTTPKTNLRMRRKITTRSFLRTDTAVHQLIGRAMLSYGFSNKHLIELCQMIGYELSKSALSRYLNNGGNHDGSLNDESIIVLCGVLGINLKLVVSSKNLSAAALQKHFDYYLPEEHYPKLKNAAYKIHEYYKKNNVIVEDELDKK